MCGGIPANLLLLYPLSGVLVPSFLLLAGGRADEGFPGRHGSQGQGASAQGLRLRSVLATPPLWFIQGGGLRNLAGTPCRCPAWDSPRAG